MYYYPEQALNTTSDWWGHHSQDGKMQWLMWVANCKVWKSQLIDGFCIFNIFVRAAVVFNCLRPLPAHHQRVIRVKEMEEWQWPEHVCHQLILVQFECWRSDAITSPLHRQLYVPQLSWLMSMFSERSILIETHESKHRVQVAVRGAEWAGLEPIWTCGIWAGHFVESWLRWRPWAWLRGGPQTLSLMRQWSHMCCEILTAAGWVPSVSVREMKRPTTPMTQGYIREDLPQNIKTCSRHLRSTGTHSRVCNAFLLLNLYF